MSKIASIEFGVNNNPLNKDVLSLIDMFQLSGWSINEYNVIRFLPLRDTDFGWEYSPITEIETVYAQIREKEKLQELIGIALFAKDVSIGVSALFYPKLEKIVFIADLNRKTILNTDITDLTWYLKNIIAVLSQAKLSIEYIRCEES
ncbi:hypothetical protein J7E50_21515 [Pedobacter sp. ISL-68]|uniref:hypothetical protein n=1 Tax=unclassified Pedobacter TaxID=2628915 RepID=UPI001BE7BA6B|nr:MULTISPECIES: hypothetical protein [unclassified Pedobacter]MBT2563782.1 hypothetical protein [Pedobacter sp. ISL-64]MBT2592812.1 hypothetical protein [Pedobacter sp. ISL-68]